MNDGFALVGWDYLAFGLFFVALSAIGYWAGRKERGRPSFTFWGSGPKR